jgi:flagellin
MKAQGTARKLNENIQNSTEKISSGSRIVRASDDAASLALSEKFKAGIRSSGQAMRNSNDAISVLQTIEGNLSTISDMTSRMRELALQAASDTVGVEEKGMADKEFQQLKNEIWRISGNSQLNGKSTISGTTEVLLSQMIDRAPGSLDFRVGSGSGSGNSENILKYKPSQLMMSKDDFDLSSLGITTNNSSRTALGKLDEVMDKTSHARATLGALQNQLARSVSVSEVTIENSSAANSRLRDLDYASETAINAKNKIVSQANTSVMHQANISPQIYLKLLA